jgi:ADP-heptose:LPS heptosyltransferase
MSNSKQSALVHLASGIGNIVFATPLVIALSELGLQTDLLLDADYAPTIELLRPWSAVRTIFERHKHVNLDSYNHVIPAIPPFYWRRFRHSYGSGKNVVRRPPDQLFYQNEQEFYLSFARALGYPSSERPLYRLPVAPSDQFDLRAQTLVIAAGCKTGEMAFKRWPFFPQLAQRFEHVVLVGTADDMRDAHGEPYHFHNHVESYIDRLSLRETAELMATAGAVVGNDSGLCHISSALGTPTLILFGPTPHGTLGQFPDNVHVLRAGLECEPCWFAKRFQACQGRIDCLANISVDRVEAELRHLLGSSPTTSHSFTQIVRSRKP